MSKEPPVPCEGLSGKAMRRAVMGSFIGALMEWYGFFTFGTAAGLVLLPLFHPDSDPFIGLIVSFATFGVGFLTRLLGSIVFGHSGDKIGRKMTLIRMLVVVGCSTPSIGFIPTHQEIGIWASLVLVVLCLIQGLGLGDEYGGAVLMTIESVSESRRGLLGSLLQMAMSVGITLAIGTLVLCNHFLTSEQFLSWGWRIPLWLPAVMLIVGLFIRLHTEETLDFQKQKTTNNKEKSIPPLIELSKKHPRNILLALGARLAESVSSNIINAFGIVYISSQLASSRDIPLTGMLIASVIDIFSCPLIGWLSDRIDQKSLYLSGAGLCVLFAFPFFSLPDSKSALIIWCSMILGYNLGSTMMFAAQSTLFTHMFGTKVRYIGLSFAYQFPAILGGLGPLIASSLLALGGGKLWHVALFLSTVLVLSFVCIWLTESTDEQGTASYHYIREQSHEN